MKIYAVKNDGLGNIALFDSDGNKIPTLLFDKVKWMSVLNTDVVEGLEVEIKTSDGITFARPLFKF